MAFRFWIVKQNYTTILQSLTKDVTFGRCFFKPACQTANRAINQAKN